MRDIILNDLIPENEKFAAVEAAVLEEICRTLEKCTKKTSGKEIAEVLRMAYKVVNVLTPEQIDMLYGNPKVQKPQGIIHHINGDPNNNSPENLTEVDTTVQQWLS